MRDALELSVRKFATEISENKKARQEINELRRERRRFKQLMALNKGKIGAMQSHVKEVVKESQAWLEERQEYANAIEELQHGADAAQEEFFAQCRELKHVMRAFDSVIYPPFENSAYQFVRVDLLMSLVFADCF